MSKTDNQLTVKSNIHLALEKIDAKLSNLGDVSESNYITEGKIDGISANIKEMKTVEDVNTAFAIILIRENGYNQSANVLGVKSLKPFTQNGFSVSAFEKDCKFRIGIITSHETRTKLEEARKIIQEQMTEEEKRAMNLEKANSILKELNIENFILELGSK
jgi:hypothetical protein